MYAAGELAEYIGGDDFQKGFYIGGDDLYNSAAVGAAVINVGQLGYGLYNLGKGLKASTQVLVKLDNRRLVLKE